MQSPLERGGSGVGPLGWAVREFVRRVYKKAEQDNIFFLAGGVSFNLLLAAVPFVLLLFSALASATAAGLAPSWSTARFIRRMRSASIVAAS